MFKLSREVWIVSAVLILCSAAFFGLWYGYRTKRGAESPPQITKSSTEIRAEWRAGVEQAMAAYDQEQNAQQAKAALLRLTVPSDARDAHLALVLALEAKIQSRADAETRLQTAQALWRALP